MYGSYEEGKKPKSTAKLIFCLLFCSDHFITTKKSNKLWREVSGLFNFTIFLIFTKYINVCYQFYYAEITEQNEYV